MFRTRIISTAHSSRDKTLITAALFPSRRAGLPGTLTSTLCVHADGARWHNEKWLTPGQTRLQSLIGCFLGQGIKDTLLFMYNSQVRHAPNKNPTKYTVVYWLVNLYHQIVKRCLTLPPLFIWKLLEFCCFLLFTAKASYLASASWKYIHQPEQVHFLISSQFFLCPFLSFTHSLYLSIPSSASLTDDGSPASSQNQAVL